MTKSKELGRTARELVEGFEDKAIEAKLMLRKAIGAVGGNAEAVDAILDAAEPIADIIRAAGIALAGDVSRARDVIEEKDEGSRK